MSEFKTDLPVGLTLHRAHVGALGVGSSAPARQEDDAAYGQDFALWIAAQISLLQDGRFDKLDVENLVEELDAIGKRQRRELAGRIETLVTHLLKCQFQPEKICERWESTLREERSGLQRLIADSPSLAASLAEQAGRTYESAVATAAAETGLASEIFPKENPYSPVQLLDPEFIRYPA